MSTKIDVVAVGGRTAVGLTAETSAAAVRAGINRIVEFPFVTEQGDPMCVAADRHLPVGHGAAERLLPLARSVLDEVVARLNCASPYRGPVRVLMAMPEARPGLTHAELSTVETEFAKYVRAQLPQSAVRVVGHGHAGVAQAIESALQSDERRDALLTVVVGLDSLISPHTLMWLEQQRVFGPNARTGMIPGEGAGCLVLASPRLRQDLKLPCLAQIRGVGIAREPLLADSDTGSLGEGMTRALRTAMAGLALPDEAVDDLYMDINGERYRSEEWGFVALRFPAAFRTLGYHAPCDSWGDVGAATGALGSLLAARAWARGYARGPRALVLTGSRNGNRGAIVLEKPS